MTIGLRIEAVAVRRELFQRRYSRLECHESFYSKFITKTEGLYMNHVSNITHKIFGYWFHKTTSNVFCFIIRGLSENLSDNLDSFIIPISVQIIQVRLSVGNIIIMRM